MEDLPDDVLIRNVQENNCSASLEILVKRHAGMFNVMAKRYGNMNIGSSGISVEDFKDNQHFIVYKAAKNFDPTRQTKFVTWLGNQVRYYCLNTINKESKYYGSEPEKIEYLMDAASQDGLDNEKILSEAQYVLDILEQIKDKRIKKIFQLRYFSEDKKKRSYNFIAKKLGMSTQGIIDLHDNFIKFMRRKIESTTNMDEI